MNAASTVQNSASQSVSARRQETLEHAEPRGPEPAAAGVAQDSAPPQGQVEVVIGYCEPGNYRARAEELRRALGAEFRVEVELVAGRGGIFEVTVDGRLVFSKRATRRLPANDEVIYHVGDAVARRRGRGP